jgi:hypothetical protein
VVKLYKKIPSLMKISNPCYVIQIKHKYEKDKKDVSHFNKKVPQSNSIDKNKHLGSFSMNKKHLPK